MGKGFKRSLASQAQLDVRGFFVERSHEGHWSRKIEANWIAGGGTRDSDPKKTQRARPSGLWGRERVPNEVPWKSGRAGLRRVEPGRNSIGARLGWIGLGWDG